MMRIARKIDSFRWRYNGAVLKTTRPKYVSWWQKQKQGVRHHLDNDSDGVRWGVHNNTDNTTQPVIYRLDIFD